MLASSNSWLIAVTLSLVFTGTLSAAGFNYRYKDNEGVMHIGYSVPPEFVANGYEVLNDQGRVVDTILPKATLDEEAAKLLLEAEVRHKHEMQAAKDEALLRFYSSPEDIERVRERKLGEFDNFIEIQQANILSNRKRVTELQHQAAQLERTGRKVPQDILSTLDTLKEKIADAEEAIVKKREEKQEMHAAFEADIERIKFLTGKTQKKLTATP